MIWRHAHGPPSTDQGGGRRRGGLRGLCKMMRFPPVLSPHLAGISEAARKKRAMRSGKLCRDDRIATVLGLSTLHWTVAAPSLVSDQVSRGPSQYTVEGTSYDRVLAHAAHAQHCCGAPGSLLAHLVVSPCRTNLGAMTSSHLTSI